ncbi:uncharacterized protein MELLADRAFT_93611 [Melampsora larici-populina 98AG31]|uniref:Uncharacterized protein n=1 Tax=Melampsora larici-populina (strain 98AG31 / pathotype 3-4-7) TaxID=747676 RepID=F4R9T8_MELLP|nr:uncharacterized protein MELLADRAFT_93611 [Melampsora larici-populina 98AG31]EGG10676.1 hypothetical protein MELLADRAFT_93611 [Melampsora larici-populina 98AG31]
MPTYQVKRRTRAKKDDEVGKTSGNGRTPDQAHNKVQPGPAYNWCPKKQPDTASNSDPAMTRLTIGVHVHNNNTDSICRRPEDQQETTLTLWTVDCSVHCVTLTESRRKTLGKLIQDAYDCGDDGEANTLLKVLDKISVAEKKDNPYVLDEEGTKTSRSSIPSITFVKQVVPKQPIPQPMPEVHHQVTKDRTMNQAPSGLAQNSTTEVGEDKATWFEGAASKEESDKVLAIMSSKKGTLEMLNGDVIHNGRILKGGNAQMTESLAPLSPGLTIILKGLSSYIQLTVFDKEWLVKDQKAWSTRTTKSDKKESGEARIYGGEAPVEELTIDFEVWSDCMELFCSHLITCGWKPVAERFEGHIAVVKKLRKDFGWMVALRYCRLVRQGVMHETIDKSIGNYAELQETLLIKAKTTAESYNERHYKTNPYAPGKPKSNICPLTNKSKFNLPSATSLSNNVTENRHASTSSYKGNGKGGRGGGNYKGQNDNGRRRNDWRKDDRYASDRYSERYAGHRDRGRSPDRRDKHGNPVKGKKAMEEAVLTCLKTVPNVPKFPLALD